jgi:hypothetical protein
MRLPFGSTVNQADESTIGEAGFNMSSARGLVADPPIEAEHSQSCAKLGMGSTLRT